MHKSDGDEREICALSDDFSFSSGITAQVPDVGMEVIEIDISGSQSEIQCVERAAQEIRLQIRTGPFRNSDMFVSEADGVDVS